MGIEFDEPPLSLRGRTFCLTGTFALAERSKLEELIMASGGAVAKSVVTRGCILVVGAESSPRWKTSNRGRKILDALDARVQGKPVAIISERYFLNYIYDV